MEQRTKPPIAYPQPGSLDSSAAAKWYLESVLRIPDVIDPDQEPREMLQGVWETKSRLRLAAALALIEAELADEFLRKMPLPSLDALSEQYDLRHDDAARKACEALLSVSEAELCAFPTTTGGAPMVLDRPAPRIASEVAGVPYGFVVRTPSGYKPIHEIRPGDLVMSAPPDGSGPPEPKRVRSLIAHEKSTLRKLSTSGEESNKSWFLATTDSLPFWVEGTGWTRTDALNRRSVLRTFDGRVAVVDGPERVFRTGQEGVGWVPNGSNWATSEGSRFDYAKYDIVETPDNPYLPREVAESMERYLRVPVYNLDVEDFYTFYVGDHWVRGAHET